MTAVQSQFFDADLAAVQRIPAIVSILEIVCDHSGMGFAAVARVTETSWTACAVLDRINFGLTVGGTLDIDTTLCKEVRHRQEIIAIDHVAADVHYRSHHTPQTYGFQSYISMPIVLLDGSYFGSLCAIDPEPRRVSDPRTVAMFESFAKLIARELDSGRKAKIAAIDLSDSQEMVALRDRFIAILGHDLRNPLASVGAIAALLKRRPEDGISAYGVRLHDNVRRMSQLIESVLDLSRAKLGGGVVADVAPIENLRDALHGVVAELREANPQQEIRETYDLGAAFEADIGQLMQLTSNLVANALAHGSSEHPIDFRVEQTASELRIAVTNQGDSIPADDLQNVFKAFWQPVARTSGKGLGLGLHICQQIVEAHGGTLTVTSSDDDGTQFVATLPL